VFGYFFPCTIASRRNPEVVVMVMVPKPCLFILGGILCEGENCVKGRFGILLDLARLRYDQKKYEEAKSLATCDGPPYYYKVAYEEAERMLERLKSEG
jgi:hypothetical protein